MKRGSFFESRIVRVYSCTNNECECRISKEEQVKDPWQTKCPFCEQESLVLESGNLSTPAFIDLKQPKTIGSLGEKNYEKALREGKKTGLEKEGKVPFWRKNKKINFNILKDSKKYIQTGHV